ncbi:MAG: hypothetical protein ACM3PA_01005 [Methanomassiliicoccales archaeon]
MQGWNHKKDEGSALIIAIMIMLILVLMGTTLLSMWSAEVKRVRYEGQRVQAYYIARSGADALGYYFEKNPENLDNTTLKNKMNSIITTEAAGQQSYSTPLGSTGAFKLLIFRQTDNQRLINIISTGTVDKVSQQITLVIEETRLDTRDENGNLLSTTYSWARKSWVVKPPTS